MEDQKTTTSRKRSRENERRVVVWTIGKDELVDDLAEHGIIRDGTNKPEARHDAILAVAKSCGLEIVHPDKKAMSLDLEGDWYKILRVIHDEHYLKFLSHAYSSWQADDDKDEEFAREEDSGLEAPNGSSTRCTPELAKLVSPAYKRLGLFTTDTVEQTPTHGSAWLKVSCSPWRPPSNLDTFRMC